MKSIICILVCCFTMIKAESQSTLLMVVYTEQVGKMETEMLVKKLATLKGVKNVQLNMVVGINGNLQLIYDTATISEKSIKKTIINWGFKISSIQSIKLSHCTINCKKMCCTYPDKKTGKCLCFQKGKDCEEMCCKKGKSVAHH